VKLEIEDANRFGKLSNVTLDKFEKRLGARLPEPYRKFLQLYNGGHPRGARKISALHHVYGLHDGPSWAQFPDREKIYDGLVPERLLPIGDDPGGNLICISLLGNDRGTVYFWDHECARDEAHSLTVLAPDFDSYILGLSWKVAVSRKRIDAVRRAVAGGLDVNRPVYGGQTRLDLAVRWGSLRMVKMLVTAGAKVRPDAIMAAVRNVAPNTVTFLLDRGADVNYADSETGFTPLMLAASGGAEKLARLLLNRGADPTPKNRWGKTAADLARTPDLKTLLQSGTR
jgi:hypothetical protein